jgi:hypothetical protein
MFENHRQYPRVPLSGLVKFYEWNRPQQAEAAEISASGMFLRTDTLLPEGTMVTLRVSLPGLTYSFTVLGKIVRSVRGNLLRSAGLGVQFIDIAAADRRIVGEFVARRMMRAA